ncbi:hypothetical protein PV04_03586 [Phialophora macrospora]|uniref:Secreted protein n=1 Tax=Phialophora macrospora TaxID=1851006 RepID=A0A0D2FSM5_9EURO|nr:hypothetical protein PV04_03586 [Phialophora macrospora]
MAMRSWCVVALTLPPAVRLPSSRPRYDSILCMQAQGSVPPSESCQPLPGWLLFHPPCLQRFASADHGWHEAHCRILNRSTPIESRLSPGKSPTDFSRGRHRGGKGARCGSFDWGASTVLDAREAVCVNGRSHLKSSHLDPWSGARNSSTAENLVTTVLSSDLV